MGFWGTLGKIGGAIGGIAAAPFTGGGSLAALPAILGAGGAALGAISQGKAQNRGAEFGGQLDLERLLMERDAQFFNQNIAREQEGRAGASDAWRKLLSAQHTISPTPRPNVSPYSAAPRQATGAEMQGADALTQEVLARLTGGNPIAAPTQRPLSVDPKLLKSGWLEKLAGYGGAGLSAYGALSKKGTANG
jgi:hypothetical protein